MPVEQTSFQVQRRSVAIVPGSANDADHTIEVVWSTGAKVRRYDWHRDRYYLEELEISESAIRMGRLNDGASVLDSHQNYSIDDILGITEKAWIVEGEGRAKLLMDVGDEKSANNWRKISTGLIRHISVGYEIHAITEIREGDEYTYLATDWEPHEISFVPVGADAGAGIRSNEQHKIPCKITRAENSATTPEGENMATEANTEGTPAVSSPEAGSEQRSQPNANTPAPAAAPAAEIVEPGSVVIEQRSAADTSAEIMEICELAGANLRTASDFIKRGVAPDNVRRELIANKAARDAEDVPSPQQENGDGKRAVINHRQIYEKYNA